MLQRLNDWRAQCSTTELADFEPQLKDQCDHFITSKALHHRYHDSYHFALINGNLLTAAMQTGDMIGGSYSWQMKRDAGREFCQLLADQDGVMKKRQVEKIHVKSVHILLQRGVIFEHNSHYCLPLEAVIRLRSDRQRGSWITVVAQVPIPMLYQLVPDDAQANMLKPKPLRIELGAWLVNEGMHTRQSNIVDVLDSSDWEILLSVLHHDLDTFEALQNFYPELEAVYVKSNYYDHNAEKISLRKTLEKKIPDGLRKLCKLGLVGIRVIPTDNDYATIVFCDEGRELLKPHFKEVRQNIAKSIQKHWLADQCEAEVCSPWSMDQSIWRIWVTLHFLTLGTTQQGKMRKNDMKKISKVSGLADTAMIESLITNMWCTDLLTRHDNLLHSVPVNWLEWATSVRKRIYDCVCRGYDWSSKANEQIYALLAQLPVERWLKLGDVNTWLQVQSGGELIDAQWSSLFSGSQYGMLYHLNRSNRCIYLLPAFHAVMAEKTIAFPAPGWRGADKKAKINGFISAAGEIQLPPDCNHSVLNKLAEFCSVSSVEQMITLQLDQKALQRLGTDKAALKKTRRVLESLQSPLPQPVVYLFDKQQAQKPVAAVAATSMVVLLHDASAIHKLRKTGFEFSQPFKNQPELVLLDASADAHAMVQACAEAGIMLDTLIKPVQWIRGTASIKAWMETDLDREDYWLEICYQKTRSSKPKQLIARIDDDYHGLIYIQGTRKTKQGLVLLKSTVRLEPKHVLRLRELDAVEVGNLKLDQLT